MLRMFREVLRHKQLEMFFRISSTAGFYFNRIQELLTYSKKQRFKIFFLFSISRKIHYPPDLNEIFRLWTSRPTNLNRSVTPIVVQSGARSQSRGANDEQPMDLTQFAGGPSSSKDRETPDKHKWRHVALRHLQRKSKPIQRRDGSAPPARVTSAVGG